MTTEHSDFQILILKVLQRVVVEVMEFQTNILKALTPQFEITYAVVSEALSSKPLFQIVIVKLYARQQHKRGALLTAKRDVQTLVLHAYRLFISRFHFRCDSNRSDTQLTWGLISSCCTRLGALNYLTCNTEYKTYHRHHLALQPF